MMRYVILMAAVIYFVNGQQRPPYAGSSNRYPVVLPRFREEQEAAASSTTTSSTLVNTDEVDNRINSENLNNVTPTDTTSTASTAQQDLPPEAFGDIELINRIKTWPRDKQPFWFINWQQIQAHRDNISSQNVQPTADTKPFFAG